MRLLFTTLLLISLTCCLFAQVSNIRVAQRTDGNFMVDIWYDLNNPEGYDIKILGIEGSDDNGATWDLKCTSLTGDVGEYITAGTDYHIVWDFYADNPNTSGSQFKVCVLSSFFSTMTGNDGTVYKTVKIGNQWWMAENLKETKYNNGSEIKVITDNYEWIHCYDFKTAARCVYNNDESNADTYGYIYNGHAANNGMIAPDGWHLPTDDEWKELEIFLGMTQTQADGFGLRGTDQGTKLKSITGWSPGNGNNLTGFSAIPGGFRYTNGNYQSLNGQIIFISSYHPEMTNSSYCFNRMISIDDGISRYYNESILGGYIRLVKD